MKLLAKFTLVFIVVFGAGGLFASYLSYRFLQDDARDQVLQQARLMMETMLSARNYTTLQIKPLLVVQQEHQRSFLPQTVPAYAATESFNYLRRKYPEYAYKEATLNPTNPRDRATDWEADVINNFRNRADQRELIGERNTPTGKYLFLAQPIHAAQPCLECHDTAQAAPEAMVRRYGAANGFGWKLNETVGAQIVSVPFLRSSANGRPRLYQSHDIFGNHRLSQSGGTRPAAALHHRAPRRPPVEHGRPGQPRQPGRPRTPRKRQRRNLRPRRLLQSYAQQFGKCVEDAGGALDRRSVEGLHDTQRYVAESV